MNETITITGNIATEPEHKHTAGRRLDHDLPASRAVSAGTTGSPGRGSMARPTGTRVSTFRSLADHAFHSLRKGDRVLLTGRLRVRDWDTGARKGTTVEIDAEAIGHDLLWGTTRFEKDRPGAGCATARATPGAARLARRRVESRPGVADDSTAEWPAPGDSRGRISSRVRSSWQEPRRRSDLTASARGGGP